ncbi:hypothetical protein BIFBIF_00151 [Bifidobacterium bifidum ATCC 29521 = JCM 1255 = DSM 20456]|nr:hypothetical protein BIFBIF_00151 [Bifidobacterium bifidum ATCC 29521 = JCM 1255 = DSM 20456]
MRFATSERHAVRVPSPCAPAQRDAFFKNPVIAMVPECRHAVRPRTR